MPQGLDRIHPGGPAGGNEAGGDPDENGNAESDQRRPEGDDGRQRQNVGNEIRQGNSENDADQAAAAREDQALDEVANQFARIIREHGPDSVAFYVSGQLLTEDYYIANKLMKGFIGSANIDTNSRLCMSSSVAGHKRAFGSDTMPGTYADLERADLVVLVGSNLAWCHPVLYQRLAAAKADRPEMRVVLDDPGKADDLMPDYTRKFK